MFKFLILSSVIVLAMTHDIVVLPAMTHDTVVLQIITHGSVDYDT